MIFASATTDSPGATAAELIGQPVSEVVEDGSPQGARTIGLWEPALRADLTGENGAPVRRSAGAEAARVMADLIAEGAQTLTFVRSRRAAELTALGAEAPTESMAVTVNEYLVFAARPVTVNTYPEPLPPWATMVPVYGDPV